ncbi:MAG: DMT family transporter [Cocleimonas sp.]
MATINLTLKTYLKLLFSMLVWGGTFTSARILGSELDPTISAFLRFLLASVMLLTLLYYKEGHFPRITFKQFAYVLGMGLTGIAMYNLFFFYGLSRTEASRGSLITSINPLITALGAAIIFKEKFTLLRIFGFILCVTGAVLIISKGDVSSLLSKGVDSGDLAFLGCATSWAIYTLLGRFVGSQLSSLTAITYASTLGMLVLFASTYNKGLFDTITTLSLSVGVNLLYLSLLATVIGFVWFQDGVKHLGAAKAAVFIYLMPVSAVFWAWLILDEKITLILIIGALLVITGVYLVNKKAS